MMQTPRHLQPQQQLKLDSGGPIRSVRRKHSSSVSNTPSGTFRNTSVVPGTPSAPPVNEQFHTPMDHLVRRKPLQFKKPYQRLKKQESADKQGSGSSSSSAASKGWLANLIPPSIKNFISKLWNDEDQSSTSLPEDSVMKDSSSSQGKLKRKQSQLSLSDQQSQQPQQPKREFVYDDIEIIEKPEIGSKRNHSESQQQRQYTFRPTSRNDSQVFRMNTLKSRSSSRTQHLKSPFRMAASGDNYKSPFNLNHAVAAEPSTKKQRHVDPDEYYKQLIESSQLLAKKHLEQLAPSKSIVSTVIETPVEKVEPEPIKQEPEITEPVIVKEQGFASKPSRGYGLLSQSDDDSMPITPIKNVAAVPDSSWKMELSARKPAIDEHKSKTPTIDLMSPKIRSKSPTPVKHDDGPAKPLLSFGTQTTPTRPETESSTKEESKPAFSFGQPITDTTSAPAAFGFNSTPQIEKKEEPPKTFSFNVRSSAEKKNEPAAFSFDAPSEPKKEEPKPFAFSTPIEPKKEETKPFSFGAPTESKALTFNAPVVAKPEEPKSLFSFGAPAETKKDETKPFSFGSSAEVKKEESKTFSFGAPAEAKTETPKPVLSFSFGPSVEAKKEEPKPFAFGSTTEVKPETPKPFAFGSSVEVKTETPKPFAFGSSVEVKKEEPKPFSFGLSTEVKKEETKPFAFGAPVEVKKEEPKPFSFGGIIQEKKEEVKPLGFGAPAAPGSFSFGQADSKPFTFGGSATQPAAETKLDQPSFNFGSTNSMAIEGSSSQEMKTEPASTGFAFSAVNNPQSQTAPAPYSFGNSSATQQPVAMPSFNFGASNTAGPNPAPVFSFSTNQPPAPSVQPFAFGGNAQQQPPQPFGNAASAQPPAPQPFGGAAPVQQFQLSANQAPSFSFGGNNQPAGGAFAFGSNPAPQQQQPAAPFGFGSNGPQQQAPPSFGAPPPISNDGGAGFNMGAVSSNSSGRRPVAQARSRRKR